MYGTFTHINHKNQPRMQVDIPYMDSTGLVKKDTNRFDEGLQRTASTFFFPSVFHLFTLPDPNSELVSCFLLRRCFGIPIISLIPMMMVRVAQGCMSLGRVLGKMWMGLNGDLAAPSSRGAVLKPSGMVN